MNYVELKKEKEKRFDKLLNDVGMFFAFSNEQFVKNKTPLENGDKYVSIGSGGYMPKSMVNLYLRSSDELNKWYKSEMKKNKNNALAEIEYELANYECYYTGSINDAFEILKDRYTKKEVLSVYYKTLEKHQECF